MNADGEFNSLLPAKPTAIDAKHGDTTKTRKDTRDRPRERIPVKYVRGDQDQLSKSAKTTWPRHRGTLDRTSIASFLFLPSPFTLLVQPALPNGSGPLFRAL